MKVPEMSRVRLAKEIIIKDNEPEIGDADALRTETIHNGFSPGILITINF